MSLKCFNAYLCANCHSITPCPPGPCILADYHDSMTKASARSRDSSTWTANSTPRGMNHDTRAYALRESRRVPTAKCRGRRHTAVSRPATSLAVGTGRPSTQVAIHRRPPSAPSGPSAQTTDRWDPVFLRYSALKLY